MVMSKVDSGRWKIERETQKKKDRFSGNGSSIVLGLRLPVPQGSKKLSWGHAVHLLKRRTGSPQIEEKNGKRRRPLEPAIPKEQGAE